MGVVRLLDGTQEFITCPDDCLRIIREKLGPDLAVKIEDYISDLEDPDDCVDCDDCDYGEQLKREMQEYRKDAGRMSLTLDNIKNQLEAVQNAPPDDIRALLVTVRELIERG